MSAALPNGMKVLPATNNADTGITTSNNTVVNGSWGAAVAVAAIGTNTASQVLAEYASMGWTRDTAGAITDIATYVKYQKQIEQRLPINILLPMFQSEYLLAPAFTATTK